LTTIQVWPQNTGQRTFARHRPDQGVRMIGSLGSNPALDRSASCQFHVDLPGDDVDRGYRERADDQEDKMTRISSQHEGGESCSRGLM